MTNSGQDERVDIREVWIVRPSSESHSLRLLLILVLAVGLIGQRTFGADDRPAIVPGSSIDRFQRPFQEHLERLDPMREGWTTEAFHDRTQAQLNTLAGQIEVEQVDPSVLATVVTSDFRCTRLRPTNLTTDFQDVGIQVQRATKRDTSDYVYGSAEGLSNAILELKSEVGDARLHAHFKTVRVQLTNLTATTICEFQLGGNSVNGAFQQSSQWHCDWRMSSADATPHLESIRVVDFEQTSLAHPSLSGPLFRDRTFAVLGQSDSFRQQLMPGIDDWVARLDRRLGIELVGTHGLAVGDVDGDGLEDLYLCEPGGLPNRLYLHKRDGTARDVSAVAGVDYLESTRSALLVDLDNDDDQDLILAADRFVVFLSNDGWGRFRRAAGFRTSAMTSSLAVADYDVDGDLDVYVCGYATIDNDTTIGLGNPVPYHDANNGARNTLYRNDGAWKFADVTETVGLDEDNMRFSLAAAWEDYDLDGDPDLYVANDYGRNCLYRNVDGRFTNVAADAAVEDISAGMSVSWGDYNQDGWPDLYISNMFSSAGNRITYQRRFKQDADATTRSEYQRFARGNTLFENVGDGTFRDVTRAAHVTMGRWAWASGFVDLNNDGWQDLVVANGMLSQQGDSGDL